ncbi:MAG: ribonuclease HI family protein [bacterium]
MYEMYIDGGARGNPGPAGIGVSILKNKRPIKEFYYYIGKVTNNIAEYSALIAGLYYIEKNNINNINIYSDSELLVKQVNNIYKVRNNNLIKYHQEVMKYKDLFNIYHIRREKNKRADLLANFGMDLYLKGEQAKSLNVISKEL